MRLHHVQLAIPAGSEAEARAFWVDVLGFREIAKPAALRSRGGLWVKSGSAEIHLGVEAEFRPARKAHPAIVYEDLDGVVASLHAAGHATEPDADIDGHRRIHTHDPFGNRLELLSSRERS